MVDIFESMKLETLPTHSHIILFDGICGLCNGSVNFIIDNDPEKVFKFAALQSVEATKLIADSNNYLNTLIYIRNGEILTRSAAVLAILQHIEHPVKVLRFFRFLPLVFLDRIYQMVSSRRYRIFGKSSQCRVPSEDLLERFL